MNRFFSKDFLIPVLFVVLIAVLFFFLYFERAEPLATEKARELDIKSFSLNGAVTRVLSSSEFSASIGVVVRGKSGNEVSYQDKIIETDDNTQFFFVSNAGGSAEVSIASFFDIKNGSDVVIHTSNYPYDQERIRADKVEILR